MKEGLIETRSNLYSVLKSQASFSARVYNAGILFQLPEVLLCCRGMMPFVYMHFAVPNKPETSFREREQINDNLPPGR